MKYLEFIAILLFALMMVIACERDGYIVEPGANTETFSHPKLKTVARHTSTTRGMAIQNMERIQGTWKIMSFKKPFEDEEPVTSMDLNRLFGPVTSTSTHLKEVSRVIFDKTNGATFEEGQYKYTIDMSNFTTGVAISKNIFNFDLTSFVNGPETVTPLLAFVDSQTGYLRLGKFRDSDFFEYFLEKQRDIEHLEEK